MNNRNKILLFLVGILLLTNIVLLVFVVGKKAPEKKHMRSDRSAVMREYLKDSVGFDDQQLAQFDQIRQQHRESIRPMFEELNNAKIAFYKGVNQAELTDSASQTAANAIGEKQKALDLAFFKHFQQVRALCKPEQVTKYDSLVQQIIKRMVSPRRGDSKQKKPDQQLKK